MQKFKNAIRNFMIGRHGSDQLSFALLILAIALWIVTAITKISIFYYIEMALYIFVLFRIFSRNNAARNAENAAFLNIWYKAKTETTQFINRTKNAKTYKYFKCPQCKCRLRIPRKVGEVTVTCSKCGNRFKQKG